MPQRWFSHFYIVGSAANGALLLWLTGGSLLLHPTSKQVRPVTPLFARYESTHTHGMLDIGIQYTASWLAGCSVVAAFMLRTSRPHSMQAAVCNGYLQQSSVCNCRRR